MTLSPLRILSLLPSATEIGSVLGLTDNLVGRSHECDYPPGIESLPVCTSPKFNPTGTSLEIHDRVTELLQSTLSVYQVNMDLLTQLQPTHILTQAQCEVCAVNLQDVEQAVASLTSTSPGIISLQPTRLSEVWADIQRVGQTLYGDRPDSPVDVDKVVQQLQSQVEICHRKTLAIPHAQRPTVACIEWPDPLMAAGNWIPELVELAGGQLPKGRAPGPEYEPDHPFGQIGTHSPWLKWETLVAANPDIIVFMPCGYDIQTTRRELQSLTQRPEWWSLKAVQTNRTYITDGNQYFNRPGPRLVESLEILAEICHPSAFSFGHEGVGWMVYDHG